MEAVSFYNNLDQFNKDILRKRFLNNKNESDLEILDYIHLKNMYDIIERESCGHDQSLDQDQIYEIHNQNE